jgi:hypothetical protein
MRPVTGLLELAAALIYVHGMLGRGFLSLGLRVLKYLILKNLF